MMGKRLNLLGVFVALILAACAPMAAPAASPTPAPQPAVPVPQAAPPLTPKETAWAQVVAAAKREGKVTIYSYNFIGDLGLALQQAFKQRYGIDLEIITGRGAEFLERLKTEKRLGKLVADTTEGSAVNIKSMKLEGLTVAIADELPALKEKGIWIIDPLSLDPRDKHLIAHFISTYAPYVNNRLVKSGEEPKVWRDLLQPKWKGKIGLTDHKISSGPYITFTPLLREKVIDEDYIRALYKQEPRLYASSLDEAANLARGEQDLMVRGTDASYARFVAEGAPIRAAEMRDGTTIGPGVAAAIAGYPHPNAAKVLLNWIMSQEGQRVQGEGRKSNSVRTDVPDFRPEPLRFIPKRPVVVTVEDNEEGARLFREKWIDKLIGKS